MSDNLIKIKIDINGTAYDGMVKISEGMDSLQAKVKKTTSLFASFPNVAFMFNQVSQAIGNAASAFSALTGSGVNFDYSLRELSAIAQVTGDDLEEIGNKARDLAKTFGGEASSYVESFKDVIGSLGDTFADSTALDMMGNNIATLSKLMGGDAKAAANALTTAMLQYGVDLKNPIEASKEATRMMNVMQAAANVGGSEVSDTAEALRQSGLLAKQSGLSFEELNASLEALAKGKVVAGEAGTAMRNMLLAMNTLQGAPQKTAEALRHYGVNVKLVSDPTAKFTDRLRELSKIQGDAVLMEDVFMKANIAAGSTILQNIDAIDEYTAAITGTNAAVEGAAIVMESYAEKQSRIKAKFEDTKISIFNATGDLGIWIQTLSEAAVPISQLVPLVSAFGSGFRWLGSTMTLSGATLTLFSGKVNRFTAYMRASQMASRGFGMNMLNMVIAPLKLLASPITGAVTAMRTLIAAKRAGTIASISFAGVSKITWGVIKTSAVNTCRAVGTAIFNIPIIGWIAAATAGIVALVRYFSRLGKSSKDATDPMKDAMQTAQSYYAQERSQLDMIFAKLQQTNPKSEERKRLVKELADLYPELNKQTLNDITNTNNLAAAYDTLILKIQQKAKVKAREAALEGLYSNMAEVEDIIYDAAEKDLRMNPKKSVSWEDEEGNFTPKYVERTMEDAVVDIENMLDHTWKLPSGRQIDGTKVKQYFSDKAEVKKISDTIANMTFGDNSSGNRNNNNGGGLNDTLKDTTDAITGGGKQVKNFYITIGNLIGENTNMFQSSQDDPQSAQSFMSKMSEALQMVVNDVNYAAA